MAHFVKTIERCYPNQRTPLFIAFFIIPTPIFWTSGILKDTIIFSLFLIVCAIAIKIYQKKEINWTHSPVLLLNILIIWKLRHFTGALAMLVISATILFRLFSHISLPKIWQTIGWISAIVVAIFCVSLFNRNLNLDYLPQGIFDNYQALWILSKETSKITFERLAPDWISLLLNIPQSVLTGLYRPFLWEGSHLMILHKIENVLLILLTVWNVKVIRDLTKPNLLAILAIILILSTCHAYAARFPKFWFFDEIQSHIPPLSFLPLTYLPHGFASQKNLSSC